MRWVVRLVLAMLTAPVTTAGAAETEAEIDAHLYGGPSIGLYLNGDGTGMMIAGPVRGSTATVVAYVDGARLAGRRIRLPAPRR
jgi:hypothetical protein